MGQIMEKCYEYNVDIFNIFIDYMHAFDSIKWNKILDFLTQNKLSSKLIRLIKLTLENTTAKVKVNITYSLCRRHIDNCTYQTVTDLYIPTIF